MPESVSISEAARQLGYSTDTIRRAIRAGELPAFKLRAGATSPWRIPQSELDAVKAGAAPDDTITSEDREP